MRLCVAVVVLALGAVTAAQDLNELVTAPPRPRGSTLSVLAVNKKVNLTASSRMTTQGYETVTLGAFQVATHGPSPAFRTLTLGYHVKSSGLCDIVMVDEANYQKLLYGESFSYYSYFSSLDTQDALLGQTEFYASDSRVLAIYSVTGASLTLQTNIQFILGPCRTDCGTTRGFCTANLGCSCNEGWEGATCATPVCSPACVRGTCTGPNTCSCPSGWGGATCNEYNCNASPCQNGGTCSGPNTCSCPSLWSGETCTVPACSPSCVRGTCNSNHQCVCPSGWTGATCNQPICDSACRNGGVCSSPNTCSCAAGWTGPTCTVPVCSPACVRGTCNNNHQCVCPSGWTGATCDEPKCDSPCQNGGTCTGSNTCSCPSGWSGATCDTPVCDPECARGICGNDHTCLCPSGWTGPTCKQPICQPACQNGGSCIAPNTCQCPPQWTGPGCLEPVCSTPCQNDGVCTGPDTCTCPARWTGPTCADPICNPVCARGTCNSNQQCVCPTGWGGVTCNEPRCDAPCQNGGTCTSTNTCSCTSGWAGATCTIPACDPACVRGTCSSEHTCVCPSGWAGPTCNQPICQPACQNGQLCTAPNTCQCPSQWTGPGCLEPVCSTPCQNGGVCTSPNTCSCPANWTGAACTVPVCTPSCVRGSCNSNRECVCPSGWGGATCDEPKCDSPCQNGGTCSGPNTCTCPPGWSGPTCTVPGCDHLCVRGHCGSNHTCVCPAGWTGPDCDSLGCSAERPCFNGGTCLDGQCQGCYSGFSGYLCEMRDRPQCNCQGEYSVCNPDGSCSCQPDTVGDKCDMSAAKGSFNLTFTANGDWSRPLPANTTHLVAEYQGTGGGFLRFNLGTNMGSSDITWMYPWESPRVKVGIVPEPASAERPLWIRVSGEPQIATLRVRFRSDPLELSSRPLQMLIRHDEVQYDRALFFDVQPNQTHVSIVLWKAISSQYVAVMARVPGADDLDYPSNIINVHSNSNHAIFTLHASSNPPIAEGRWRLDVGGIAPPPADQAVALAVCAGEGCSNSLENPLCRPLCTKGMYCNHQQRCVGGEQPRPDPPAPQPDPADDDDDDDDDDDTDPDDGGKEYDLSGAPGNYGPSSLTLLFAAAVVLLPAAV